MNPSTLVPGIQGQARSSAAPHVSINQPICRGYGLPGGRCVQPVDVYHSPSPLASYLQTPHMAQQRSAACKRVTVITEQQMHSHANSNRNRGPHAKFYRVCLLFGFSAKSAGRLVSLRSTPWHERASARARGQIFSSTSDAHQREGAGRMTHPQPSCRQPASRRTITIPLWLLVNW